MPYRLACADFTFPLLPHARVLKLIAMLELEGVDIGLFEGRSHLRPSQEFQAPGRSGAALKRQLEGEGLVVTDVFLQMDPDFAPYAINQPDGERRALARDWFARLLDYAAAAGARHVTTLPGVLFAEEPAAVSHGRAVDELACRVEMAQQYGIVFGVEPHVGSLAPEPALAAELVASVPGLTLSLDYTHFTRMGMPDATVEPLTALASHFHVRGARAGRLQASFRENTIDYGRVLQALAANGYKGWLGLEYVWIDWEHANECDNLSETILFRDELRRLMHH
jgi:sugar phosphate isomerase/epimerase